MSLLAKKKSKPEEAISFPSRYRVIAADLSLKRPGFCKMIIDQTANEENRISSVECINVNNKTSKKNADKPHGEILDDVLRAMSKFFHDKNDPIPSYYVCEQAALGSMPVSMISQAKAKGMTEWLLWRLGFSWYEITPDAIKNTLTGYGLANKKEVEQSLSSYLNNVSYNCDDESDAAAVAIAWLISHGQISEKPNSEDFIKAMKARSKQEREERAQKKREREQKKRLNREKKQKKDGTANA